MAQTWCHSSSLAKATKRGPTKPHHAQASNQVWTMPRHGPNVVPSTSPKQQATLISQTWPFKARPESKLTKCCSSHSSPRPHSLRISEQLTEDCALAGGSSNSARNLGIKFLAPLLRIN
ncbi:hypothetical protein PIB30_078863 [Stylosanthes scabra]|uniref:Uncharacterized protein n=1 Tax=Stylosanthes scabra TaxID=79078 RepID=A0ABU6QQJ2_9FABA|nr:hypothetical protein [Stylosanthes scabra]